MFLVSCLSDCMLRISYPQLLSICLLFPVLHVRGQRISLELSSETHLPQCPVYKPSPLNGCCVSVAVVSDGVANNAQTPCAATRCQQKHEFRGHQPPQRPRPQHSGPRRWPPPSGRRCSAVQGGRRVTARAMLQVPHCAAGDTCARHCGAALQKDGLTWALASQLPFSTLPPCWRASALRMRAAASLFMGVPLPPPPCQQCDAGRGKECLPSLSHRKHLHPSHWVAATHGGLGQHHARLGARSALGRGCAGPSLATAAALGAPSLAAHGEPARRACEYQEHFAFLDERKTGCRPVSSASPRGAWDQAHTKHTRHISR